MKRLKFTALVLLIMCLFAACGVNKETSPQSNEKKANNIEDLSVEQETFEQLIKESKNEELKKKVLEHLKSKKHYQVIDEINNGGFVYKSMHIDLTYTTAFYDKDLTDILLETEGIKKELEKETNNIIANSHTESYGIRQKVSAKAILGMHEDKGRKMSFERGEDFAPFEECMVAVLVKYDDDSNIVDAVMFDGAVGNSLIVKDNKVYWEVCIARKVDFYYWGVEHAEQKEIDGIGKMSGDIYNMGIDDKLNIIDIRFVRETKNNDFDSTCVKNYELTIGDFINSEELKKLITANPSDFKNRIRKIYGMEHEQGAHVKMLDSEEWCTQDAMYYFTTDGYLVNITTVPRWTKIAMEDAYKIGLEEWEGIVSELMFVGELNSEFEEVNIDKNKEGDITNVDTLVDKSEERRLKEYLESIKYDTYDISIQNAMEYNGKKYIAIQMDLWRGIDEGDINRSFLWDGVTYLEEFEEIKINLDEKDRMTATEHDAYNNYMSKHLFIKQKDDIGHLITYGDRMNIEHGWMVTKLLVIDDSGNMLNEMEYEGAITTGLGVRDGCVEWEVYTSNKVDYYAVKCEGDKQLSGHGYSSGNVYRLTIDERNLIDKKELIRESYDNDYASLCIKEDYDYQNSDNRHVYVKNYDLTIKSFIGDRAVTAIL